MCQDSASLRGDRRPAGKTSLQQWLFLPQTVGYKIGIFQKDISAQLSLDKSIGSSFNRII
jgi:hypothetical protein